MKIPKITTLWRKNFLAGLIVLVPFWIIFLLAKAIFKWLLNLYALVPVQLQLESMPFWLDTIIFCGVLAVVSLGVSFLGWLSKRYFGQKLLQVLGIVIQKIPILGSVYSSIEQLLRTLTTGGKDQFRGAVYVQFPRQGIWAIGFVTGPVRTPNSPENHLNVFIPCVPNPTSGFHLMVPESEVKESGLSVEEAFKTILSLGMASSGSKISHKNV